MISTLYNLTAKGLLKALSFILASALFVMFITNSTAPVWRAIFLPLMGYIIVITAIIYLQFF